VKNNFSIVTGAGGTGKTEVAALIGRYIAYVMKDELYTPSVCVAPSGKATEVLKKRLGSGRDAFTISTIHRWILMVTQGSRGVVPFLFVDEASMVDLWTTWHLLQTACNIGVQRIVLFGDPQQLAPIDGRGTILDAFVMNHSSVVIPLVTNYRSEEGLLTLLGNIRSVADGSGQRIHREWFETSNSVLEIVPNHNPSVLYATILRHLPGLDPVTTRVIASTNAPLIKPTLESNTSERESFLLEMYRFFNPRVSERKSNVPFYVGDLVRSTMNLTISTSLKDGGRMFELVVTNGSEGIVSSVEPLSIVFHGGYKLTWEKDSEKNVRDLLDTLECGFLSSIHKFQGSEAKTVIAVFTGKFVPHNTIQLLYTAVSRSQQRLILIMEQQNIDLYCMNPGHVIRNTGFNTRVRNSL
jgi:exodeoxyribonuclease V alpha subunit